jgi:hypothetical protein
LNAGLTRRVTASLSAEKRNTSAGTARSRRAVQKCRDDRAIPTIGDDLAKASER